MSVETAFTKEKLELYLRELAKEYRKLSRGVHAEMILIGGASVLINYGFRESTTDVDAIYMASAVMKEARNAVGDRLGLPYDWLNSDFMRTSSYTPRLVQYSTYYKTYAHVLDVRTVRAEYLIAMKLVSGRKYKKDISDIVGILIEQEKAGSPLTFEMIDTAVVNLHNDWSKVDPYAKEVLMASLKSSDLESLYIQQSEDETEIRNILLDAETNDPGFIKKAGINEIISKARSMKQNGE